jgi:hypothetical protein
VGSRTAAFNPGRADARPAPLPPATSGQRQAVPSVSSRYLPANRTFATRGSPTPPASLATPVGWEFVHVTIDDATRLAYAEVLCDEHAATAVGFLRRAIALPGPARDAAGRARHGAAGNRGLRYAAGAGDRDDSCRLPRWTAGLLRAVRAAATDSRRVLISVLIRARRKPALLKQTVAALVRVEPVEHQDPRPPPRDRCVRVSHDVRVLRRAERQSLHRAGPRADDFAAAAGGGRGGPAGGVGLSCHRRSSTATAGSRSRRRHRQRRAYPPPAAPRPASSNQRTSQRSQSSSAVARSLPARRSPTASSSPSAPQGTETVHFGPSEPLCMQCSTTFGRAGDGRAVELSAGTPTRRCPGRNQAETRPSWCASPGGRHTTRRMDWRDIRDRPARGRRRSPFVPKSPRTTSWT